MSNEESQSSWVQIEPLKDLVIDPEDVKNIVDFYRHFELKMPERLQDALKAYENAYVCNLPEHELIKLQNELRIQLALSIIDGENEIFKRDIFTEVVDTCKKVSFVNSFEKSLKDLLTED